MEPLNPRICTLPSVTGEVTCTLLSNNWRCSCRLSTANLIELYLSSVCQSGDCWPESDWMWWAHWLSEASHHWVKKMPSNWFGHLFYAILWWTLCLEVKPILDVNSPSCFWYIYKLKDLLCVILCTIKAIQTDQWNSFPSVLQALPCTLHLIPDHPLLTLMINLRLSATQRNSLFPLAEHPAPFHVLSLCAIGSPPCKCQPFISGK